MAQVNAASSSLLRTGCPGAAAQRAAGIGIADAFPAETQLLHGIPRDVLLRHVMQLLTRDQCRALDALEVSDGGRFVNMGMNFDSVAWRAVWRLPGLPALSGRIPVWKGEIVS
jgi:hypothetical protein